MPQSTAEERYRWIKPILEREISIKDMSKVCPFSMRSLKYWLAAYRQEGYAGLSPRSTRPKTHPKETPIHIKEQVIALRKKTKLCALKLSWELADQGVAVHPRTIGKIIKAEGMVRSYRVKRTKYKYIKAVRKPGDLIEIDVKYVPGNIANKRFFQYTAIDTATRWRHLAVYDAQSNSNSITFLKEVMELFPYRICAIKTDNGAIFTNRYTGTNKRSDQIIKRLHALDEFCAIHDIIHYLIDPGKPAQNGTVERSHREDQEKFYEQNTFKNYRDLQRKLKRWNMYYNDLRHCGLNGLTPNQALAGRVQNVRT